MDAVRASRARGETSDDVRGRERRVAGRERVGVAGTCSGRRHDTNTGTVVKGPSDGAVRRAANDKAAEAPGSV